MGSEYIQCGSSGVPALFLHFYGFVSVAYCCDPTFIACPHGLPIVRYLYWFFRHVWYLVLCFWGVGAAYADGSCAGSSCYLAQGCRGGGFFPNSVVFALVLGLSVLFTEFFGLVLVFLGCTCGVALSLRLPLLSLGHRLRWLDLGVFAAALLTGCTCICVCVLSGVAELCLLSLRLLGAGLAVVEPLAGVCFCASSCGFPLRVLPLVALRGFRYLFWLQLPVLLRRWSSVCWVCGVFGEALGFPPCAVLFFRGLRFCAASPAAGCPSGFLPFLTPYTWPTAALVA